MSASLSAGAVALVCVLTLAVGAFGLRVSRATSDFYVAGRTVTPFRNASAIGGEYLSAASFLGIAGLVYEQGVDMLWFPVGYTVGYVVLLVLVAAPLRRSGAYTLPDFAEARLESRRIRLVCSVLVVAIGWLYLLPQFAGAGITLSLVTGAPLWLGGAVVAVVVVLSVAAGGMRSITLVQAMQYWLKLAAISIPAFVLLAVWARAGGPAPVADLAWQLPLGGDADGHTLYRTYSLLLALALGTMGLPHVLVRFYTNPDGGGARRTTVTVIALLGIFYVFTPVYGVLGKAYLPVLPEGARVDSITLRLPSEMLPGLGGDVLTAMLAGGAFAAFLSTASGLSISVTGVINQDLLRPLLARMSGGDHSEVRAFRYAAVPAVVVPYAVSPVIGDISLATMVGLAFAVAASTFAPLLVLGVWWPRLTTVGAASGLVVGGVLAAGSVGLTLALGELEGWPGALLAQPGAWSVPTATAVAVLVSLATPHRIPRGTGRTLARLHTPEGARSP